MSFFFKTNGQVNLFNLSLTSGTFFATYLFTFIFGINQVKEPGMTPTLRLNREFSKLSKRTDYSDQSFFKKLSSFVMADKVLYRKLKPSDLKQLIGKVVAVQNPFNVKEVVYRRITATEHFWVRRMDNAGIIEIPKHHVWIECECKEEG